jgi:hypothetical protein
MVLAAIALRGLAIGAPRCARRGRVGRARAGRLRGAHTVHFATVLWSRSSRPARTSVDARVILLVVVAGVLRRRRVAAPACRTSPSGVSRGELAVTIAGWIVFAQAFAFRTQSIVFAPLLVAAVTAILIFLTAVDSCGRR